MTTHISYSTAKKLKAFLGESAPEPMDGYYVKENMWYQPYRTLTKDAASFPAYQLHDLLSKPFCEAFTDALERINGYCPVESDKDMSMELAYKNYFGGLPAVEKALLKMMGGK